MEVLNYGGNELSEKLQALDVARANELFLNYRVEVNEYSATVYLEFNQLTHIEDRWFNFTDPLLYSAFLEYENPIYVFDPMAGVEIPYSKSIYFVVASKESGGKIDPNAFVYFNYNASFDKPNLPYDLEGRTLTPNGYYDESSWRKAATYYISLNPNT